MISDQQKNLLKELNDREGKLSVMKYLVEHEGFLIGEALDIYRKEFPESGNCELPSYSHYCMNCDECWVGKENSNCPICHTDGSKELSLWQRFKAAIS